MLVVKVVFWISLLKCNRLLHRVVYTLKRKKKTQTVSEVFLSEDISKSYSFFGAQQKACKAPLVKSKDVSHLVFHQRKNRKVLQMQIWEIWDWVSTVNCRNNVFPNKRTLGIYQLLLLLIFYYYYLILYISNWCKWLTRLDKNKGRYSSSQFIPQEYTPMYK